LNYFRRGDDHHIWSGYGDVPEPIKGKVALWLGAGISRALPTDAPLGYELTQWWLEQVCDGSYAEELLKAYKKLSPLIKKDMPRLEQLIELSSKHHSADVLSLLDVLKDLPPNPLHHLICEYLIENKSWVITTNFDECLESSNPHIPVYVIQSPECPNRILQEIKSGAEDWGILKIHGTISQPTASMGVTVENITQNYSDGFSELLEHILFEEPVSLVFAGYGGSDFFDVVQFLRSRSDQEGNCKSAYIKHNSLMPDPQISYSEKMTIVDELMTGLGGGFRCWEGQTEHILPILLGKPKLQLQYAKSCSRLSKKAQFTKETDRIAFTDFLALHTGYLPQYTTIWRQSGLPEFDRPGTGIDEGSWFRDLEKSLFCSSKKSRHVHWLKVAYKISRYATFHFPIGRGYSSSLIRPLRNQLFNLCRFFLKVAVKHKDIKSHAHSRSIIELINFYWDLTANPFDDSRTYLSNMLMLLDEGSLAPQLSNGKRFLIPARYFTTPEYLKETDQIQALAAMHAEIARVLIFAIRAELWGVKRGAIVPPIWQRVLNKKWGYFERFTFDRAIEKTLEHIYTSMDIYRCLGRHTRVGQVSALLKRLDAVCIGTDLWTRKGG